MQIDFNYIGCYRSVADRRNSRKPVFTIDAGIGAPCLRKHLVPEKLNAVKQLDSDECLDLTIRKREKYIDDGAGEKMETILQFINELEPNEINLRKRIGCEIVCNRGLLVKLAMGANVEFRAVRRKDVIFMCMKSWDTLRYDRNRHLSTKFAKRMTHDYYYKVLTKNMQLVCTGIVNKIVNQVKFPNATVLSSAEVDSRNSCGNIVELKMTNRNRKKPMPNEKRMKDFLQCYLSNTEIILTGYWRENEDNKQEIHELEMIHRDRLIDNFLEVSEAMQCLVDTFSMLKLYLSENDMAVLGTGTTHGLLFKYIEADECEFVSQEFLRQFE